MPCISDILTNINTSVDAIKNAVGGANSKEGQENNVLPKDELVGEETGGNQGQGKMDAMLTKLDALITLGETNPAAIKSVLMSANEKVITDLKASEEETRNILKAAFAELLPTKGEGVRPSTVTGKAVEALKTVTSPEDFDTLSTEATALMEKECPCSDDFQQLFDLLNQVLEKAGLTVDGETGLMTPIEASATLANGFNGGINGSNVSLDKKNDEVKDVLDDKKITMEAWNIEIEAFKDNAIGAFDAMLQSGEFSIKSLGKQLKQMAKNMLVQKLIPMMFGFSDLGAASGGGLGGLLGSFFGRETGGRVSAGTPYLVGEKRPEIFIPDHAGTVARSLGEGAGAGAKPAMNMVQNVHFTPDVKNTVRAEIYQAAPQIAATAKAMVYESLRGNRY